MNLISFLKKPSVMIITGIIGFVGTNVLTAKCTYNYIKAKEAIDHDTTLQEDIVLAVKSYAPAATAGVISAGLIFSGNKTYSATNASLMTGYTLLNTKYKNYRDAALKTLGFDQAKDIEKLAIKTTQIPVKKPLKPVSEGCILIRDPMSDPKDPRFLETTMDVYLESKYEWNKVLAKNNKTCLNDWYEIVGFETNMTGETFGYNTRYLCEVSEDRSSFIDIGEEIVLGDDNFQYYEVLLNNEPIAGWEEM
jgi:hypothetical protein